VEPCGMPENVENGEENLRCMQVKANLNDIKILV
jgi:hypothetical protein